MSTLAHNMPALRKVLIGKDVLIRSVHNGQYGISSMITILSLEHCMENPNTYIPCTNETNLDIHRLIINGGSMYLHFTKVKLNKTRTSLCFFYKRTCIFEISLNHYPLEPTIPTFPSALLAERELQEI